MQKSVQKLNKKINSLIYNNIEECVGENERKMKSLSNTYYSVFYLNLWQLPRITNVVTNTDKIRREVFRCMDAAPAKRHLNIS